MLLEPIQLILRPHLSPDALSTMTYRDQISPRSQIPIFVYHLSPWSQSYPYRSIHVTIGTKAVYGQSSTSGVQDFLYLSHTAGIDPVKLRNKTDLVVTGYEDDMEALKTKDTNTILFSTEGLVAGVDVDAPPWYGCKVCNCHRGFVFLPNGERWHWIEIDSEHYQFKREDNRRDQDIPLKTLIWEFQNSWRPSNELPADLPFAVNRHARVCRVSESNSLAGPVKAGSPVAVMNRDGFIFFDGVGSKMAEIQTQDNRALILISGLAIAKFEGWLAGQ
ncbi:hypothetical protein PITC_005700 [Penicillium italicum]|uniref:Uncharacterized protein n=1 Tax=Penicillium italicum TaxID=40296 RepID=A0A0A2LKV4_PENIT|nr:hypothetical protein PITC_005700 [Penicillium italicum]